MCDLSFQLISDKIHNSRDQLYLVKHLSACLGWSTCLNPMRYRKVLIFPPTLIAKNFNLQMYLNAYLILNIHLVLHYL